MSASVLDVRRSLSGRRWIWREAEPRIALGIAQRLNVDPHRVVCDVRIGPSGGLLIDVNLDGRDLTGPQMKLVTEYLQEAFHGILPRIEG